jgi:hypothetical protein
LIARLFDDVGWLAIYQLIVRGSQRFYATGFELTARRKSG